MRDGSISGFIVKTDLAGNTIQSISTGTFHPEQLCEAPDGTVWSLGESVNAGAPEPDAEVVRQYDFGKGLLHSFLPENTVRAVLNSSKPWFNPFGSFLRCGKEKVSIYLEFTDEYAEIDNSSFALTRWKLDQSVVQQRKANGLAVTDDGKVYVSFSAHGAHGVSGPYGLTSLYQVEAEPGKSGYTPPAHRWRNRLVWKGRPIGSRSIYLALGRGWQPASSLAGRRARCVLGQHSQHREHGLAVTLLSKQTSAYK